MSESGKSGANAEHFQEFLLGPRCFKCLAIHHDHVIDSRKVDHQEK